jgi:hypothetical protein
MIKKYSEIYGENLNEAARKSKSADAATDILKMLKEMPKVGDKKVIYNIFSI